MERTPLRELGNILPTCLNANGRKKLGLFPAKALESIQGTIVTIVKPTPKAVSGQENTVSVGNGKAKPKTTYFENDPPKGPPGTPLKTAKSATPPLTPLANLKVLIAAASTALENEVEQQVNEVEQQVIEVDDGIVKLKETTVEDGGGRKMRSLAILCKRFLSIAESDIGVGVDFSLETMAKKLGTNRRRIYDIINVLEALEMIVKQSKNWYTWLGQDQLLITLAKMKAMAEDDVDFRVILNKDNGWALGKETQARSLPPAADQPTPSLSPSELSPSSQPSTSLRSSSSSLPPAEELEQVSYKMQDDTNSQGGEEAFGMVSGGRWDKSLGVLCQKFIMLFLITPDHEVTLDYAGNVLMPDETSLPPLPPTNPKTKVRRLYDIANVLTTLGLIRKKTFLAPNHRKMPGYSWAGPTLDQIGTIPIFRKSESNLYPFYCRRKGNGNGGTSLTRKPSFGSMRPFLHQYEVKVEGSKATSTLQPNSAPSSPLKSKESGFKRSLSFGAGPARKQLPKRPHTQSSLAAALMQNQRKSDVNRQGSVLATSVVTTPISPASNTPTSSASGGKCVVARQLPQLQGEYLQEVMEFEAEILRHANKYPHIAPVFHDFVIKFHNTLRQATVKTAEHVTTSHQSNTPNFNSGDLNLFGVTSEANSPSVMPTSVAMVTTYAEMVSPPSAPEYGNAVPSSEPTTLIPSDTTHCNLDVASFNPNSLLVTSPMSYTLVPTSTPSFFCYPSSLSSAAIMAAAMSRTGGVTCARSLAPKPRHSEQVACAADDISVPSKKARLENS